MSDIKNWLTEHWVYNLVILGSLVVLAIFLLFRIDTIPVGYSPTEWIMHNNMAAKYYNFSYLWHNVAFAPYYIVLMVPEYLNRYGLFAIRSTGVLFGLISVIIFYYINWRWWGNLIAVLSTLIFATGLAFLQVTRNSGPVILYVYAALIIILLGFVVRNKKRHDTKTLFSALLALQLLYIPGIIWFLIAAAILQRDLVRSEFKKLFTQVKIIIPISGIILLTPLIYSSITNFSTLKTVLGFPQQFSFISFLHNFVGWFLIIFIWNPVDNIYSIGHLPILSIFIDVMLVLGIYWLWQKRKLNRIYLLGATIILSWFLYALGGPVSIYLALPFILCIAATGMAYILGLWYKIFPRNPVARTLGITILAISVLVVCLYHFDQYFVAWPKTTKTLTVYSTHKL
jgi:hypothetical protein